MNDCRRYGSVTIDNEGAVKAFHEKSSKKRAGLINAGIYLLERESVASVPEGEQISIELEVFPQLIGHGLYAVVGEGPFLDIGVPESYAEAQRFFALK
jgi:NDP-sugar pyrophosphorylase family protein